MSKNLRIAAAEVLVKINVLLEAGKANPQEFKPNKITEYLSAFRALLKDALKLHDAEKKLNATSGTNSVIADLVPELGYAMSNDELRQAINDTIAHLRPTMIGQQLPESARQQLCAHLEYLLLAERERIGVMFAHHETESDTTKPGAQQT